ncbi:hypothetical protein KSP40_PGU007426 [Platanthera guangdongensis]|uniref:Uncharacterized protein n=1 Tax=Platanthera guangdongensis TaxID=2320717 RepID=A0ABR2MY61_9ASPA
MVEGSNEKVGDDVAFGVEEGATIDGIDGGTSWVFYCGVPVLGQELRKLCSEFNQRGATRFEFHKEHF